MRRLAFVFACWFAACGGSSGSSVPGTSSGGASSGGSGNGSSGGQADGGSGSDGGGGSDGGDDAPSEAGAGCACDATTQYCLHGDVTTSGEHNVDRCQPRVGDCVDCSCYSQIGLCLEVGLPKGCSMKGPLVVVDCAEIP
jgi:hypothetical protein